MKEHTIFHGKYTFSYLFPREFWPILKASYLFPGDNMSVVKKLVILAAIAFVGTNLNAQESGFTFRPFFGGGGWTAVFDGAGGYSLGGTGEFAFLFYDRGMQIGGHIVGRGNSITTSHGNSYGTGAVSGKISFGGLFPISFLRGYSFIEGGIGFGGGNETGGVNFIFGGGGGVDLFFHRHGSIYLEVGYFQHSLNNEIVGGAAITIGIRGYFR